MLWALVIARWKSIVWWVLEKIIVLFCMPKFPMPNCQSNLELSIYTDSMKVILVYWRVAYREFLFGGHPSLSLPWVPCAQMPNTQLPMTNNCHGNLYWINCILNKTHLKVKSKGIKYSLLRLTCKYSLSVKFCCGHHAVEEDKDACAAENWGESSEDDVTVLLEK